MGVALYRKYRSRKLSDIVGQEHVTTLLSNAVSSNKLAHAYLFTGPRGVGKTSIARILAHEINELPYSDDSQHLDIIEIDAASNNGVEDIRDLRDRIQTAPVSAKKKVYIIDEVHMLSKAAFNALLKTLEEPPEHVVFILATTDIDKVPETIISRAQRHTFRRASVQDIVKNLQRIAKGEKVTAEESALELIAKHADGSFRDSVSLFDQLISGNATASLSREDVTTSLGLISDESTEALVLAATKGNIQTIDTTLRDFENRGIPARTTAAQLADYLRLHIATNPRYADLIDSLLEVSKSPYPELKLLTSLSLFTSPTAHSTSVTSTPRQSHSTPTPSTSNQIPPISSPPAKSVAASVATASANSIKKELTPVPQNTDELQTKKVITNPSDFDWQKLIAYVRTNHVALHSVLSKCEPEFDGEILTLYTKSAFYKKKLDDPKYRLLISSSLIELGVDIEIDTVASQKPLKDSQAAKVAAIMGGGEEVSVDDA